MREIPLSEYARWPNPNYDDPVTRGDALLVVNIVFIILVTFSISIRLYSRAIVKCQTGMDDVMIVLAYIFTIGLTATVLVANRQYGWDRHIWDLPSTLIQHTSIVAFVAKIMFALASGFIRLSLIFLYYRLIRDTNFRWYAYALHFSLAFNVAIIILLCCLGIFLCIPVQAYWQFPNVISGKCMDEGIVLLGGGILTCVADLLCTVLPIPAVMRLKMPLRERIGVCCLLSAGLVVTVAGVIRTYFVYQGLIATYDETWYTYPLWICAAIEIHLAVICACVPSMKSVLWQPFRRWTSSVASHYLGTRTNDGFETISHSPTYDSAYPCRNDYQLQDLEEKSPRYVHQDLNTLEKAIAQLPPPGSHHPHQMNDTACVNRCTENAKAQAQPLQPPMRPHRPNLEINKETVFTVSRSEGYQDQYLPRAPPQGPLPHRPRHQPLIDAAMHQRHPSDVTPRGPGNMSTRRHAPAALPPTSPPVPAVAQNITSPLPPPTPMTIRSSLSSHRSEFDMARKKSRRAGKTFFFD